MYWQDRAANAQTQLSKKNLKQIEKQLRKYYGTSMERVIRDFERVYKRILKQQEDGKEITPADLYKLDAYWKMQGQLRKELQKLNDKQNSMLSKIFELHFFDIYYSINIEGLEAFSTIDSDIVHQLIQSIWTADNKTFSQRIWDNTARLTQTLNDELVHCVITGKKTTELKKILQERFNVSYRRADTLARTEIAHIQTQAAKQRYKDYGLDEMQVWADPDERTCPVCGKLHKKIYSVNEQPPIPAHPNCRCTMIPVIK